MSQPDRVAKIYQTLEDVYPTFAESNDPWITEGLSDTPFRVIVSTALSTVTHTKRVIRACVPLFQRLDTFEELAAIEDDELREIIRPVAHYNVKTQSLKKMARQILEEHGGQIPDTHEQLMQLSGIGRKCADIVMTELFESSQVAVDTHVHRLANRLGIISTTTAEQSADRLNDITPDRFRRHAHELLIQHGGKICVARKPKCDQCPLIKMCDWAAEHHTTRAAAG